MLVEDEAEVGEGLEKEERQVLAWQGRAATRRLLRDGLLVSWTINIVQHAYISVIGASWF